MNDSRRKVYYAIGGIAAALLVIAVVLVIAFGGRSSGRYEKHYQSAEAAFLHRDYDSALKELDRAMEIDATEECYLLMANIYCAQGDTDMAVQVLYLGYSHTGSAAISERLEEMKAAKLPEHSDGDSGRMTVGGESFALNASSAVLSGKHLGNSDLAALGALTALESLSLTDNDISDLSPLSGLKALTTLHISDNDVSDLSPLSGLTALKTLYIDGNPVRDLSPLFGLSNLRTLSMKDIPVTAAELAALQKALPDCSIFADAPTDKVVEITLGGRTFGSDVTELNLGGLGIEDISALAACTKLQKLDLRDNRISDISPLIDLQELEWLCLWNNNVEDVRPLMSLSKLAYLDLDTNMVSDITALQYLSGLEELWLSNNPVRALSPLEKLQGLQRLGLKNVGAADDDLDMLETFSDLKELDLQSNPALTANRVEALQKALPDCTVAHDAKLWTLKLGKATYTSDCTAIRAGGAGITDLSGLEHFTSLITLELDNNPIRDLSPLHGLTSLRTLYLRGCDVSPEDVAALQKALPNCLILSDAPVETPEDSGDDPAGISVGSSAALDAAGTGSGYGILWCRTDPSSLSVRSGFLSQAEQLGMNVVCDNFFESGCEDFSTYLTHMERAGADVVVLAADDDTAARIAEQAAAMRYAPEFIQVY